MKYLVTVADDFGFSPGVNDGCREAFQNGILKEMSLMMDSPATKEAVAMVLQEKIDGVGIHITLNDIVGTGKYLRTEDYQVLLAQAPQEKLVARVKEELSKFEDVLGRPPTHINGHKNCHLHPKLIQAIAEYSSAHNIFVRKSRVLSDGNSAGQDMNDELSKMGVKTTDFIFEHIAGSYEEAIEWFLADLSTVPDNTATEIFFHPARIDALLQERTSLLWERERDLRLLTDLTFREKIKEMNFTISNFQHPPLL
jgi:predicted glycoside hydrolase/deacetylase ChbG (UPF0249 family)